MPDGRATEQNLAINTDNDACELPLYNEKKNSIHEKSGLNWGQRKGRDGNQAYIPIPQKIVKRKFFPEKAHHFTVTTDDGHYFVMTVAQDGDKALHTPQNNSLIGEYFRNRLGVLDKAKVELADLERYGRKYVKFTKLDEDDYFMDFSI